MNGMADTEIFLSDSKHKRISKVILIPGDFSLNAVEGSECEIEISEVSIKDDAGNCRPNDNSVILSEAFRGQLTIGKSLSYIDIDIERCLQHMFVGETSDIRIIYLDKNESVIQVISCKITILRVTDPGLFCDWHWAKRVTHAINHKDSGVQLFKDKRVIDSFRQFSKALKFVLTLTDSDFEAMSETDKNAVTDLKVKLYNNMAHCQLQFNEFDAAVVLCTKVLAIDQGNAKALYRRCSALMGLSDWEAAYADICQVLTINPEDSAAKQKASVLREKVKHINEAYKKVIRNMFV